jgi:GTP cyclohydrolase I
MPSREEAVEGVRHLLKYLSDSLDLEVLAETPERVVAMYEDLFAGYRSDPIDESLHPVDGELPVVLGEVPFYSMCEHHLLPFFGKVWVAYQARDKVIGLSSVPRVINGFARRLQIQERLTRDIADEIARLTGSGKVLVRVKAEHLCVSMRGSKAQGANVTTEVAIGDVSALRGLLESGGSR